MVQDITSHSMLMKMNGLVCVVHVYSKDEVIYFSSFSAVMLFSALWEAGWYSDVISIKL